MESIGQPTYVTGTSPAERPDFEQAFRQLEEAVQTLEAGNLPLDEAVALFEKGMKLAATCTACLDAAELRLKQLVPGPDGAPELESWDPDGLRNSD